MLISLEISLSTSAICCMTKIAQAIPDSELFDAVNAFFDSDLSCIALTNVDGTVESKAFNYIENKVIH